MRLNMTKCHPQSLLKSNWEKKEQHATFLQGENIYVQAAVLHIVVQGVADEV